MPIRFRAKSTMRYGPTNHTLTDGAPADSTERDERLNPMSSLEQMISDFSRTLRANGKQDDADAVDAACGYIGDVIDSPGPSLFDELAMLREHAHAIIRIMNEERAAAEQ